MSTVRTYCDKSGILIKTQIEVSPVLFISKFFTGDYYKISQQDFSLILLIIKVIYKKLFTDSFQKNKSKSR